jgi:uncharacterized membrane protein YoaK (UPF0700 family)
VGVAGWVDAVGFQRLGHFFVSFMSGDSTQLATAVVRGDGAEARRAGTLILGFLVGVMLGRLVARAAGPRRRPAVLAGVALLLALAIAVASRAFITVVPLVLAMGMQNATLHKAGEIKIGATYVTGTLVRLGESLTDALFAWDWTWAPYALLWLSLVVGAMLGALAHARFGMAALAVPALANGLLALLLATGRPEPGSHVTH